MGPGLGGWGPWLSYRVKCGANLTQNVGQNVGQILWQNVGQILWQSHDSSRRLNPEKRWKSSKIIKYEMISVGSHLAGSGVPFLENGSFWGRRGFEVG